MNYDNSKRYDITVCFRHTEEHAEAESVLYSEWYPEERGPFKAIFAILRHNLIDSGHFEKKGLKLYE